MYSNKYIHQSQATLDPGNIYTSTAYEKTKKQYNERMNRLRTSNISNQISNSPGLRQTNSRSGFYQQEYGHEFELQPKVTSQREQIYGTYGVPNRPKVNHQALMEKYGSRENLNIYSQKRRVSKKKYRHTEYHY